MISYDDVLEMLDAIAAEFPKEFYTELNGGIILNTHTKKHPENSDIKDLYILGQYHYDPHGLGRYIIIYYGSFIRVYGHLAPESQRAELKKILSHEFTHHIESLAGERSLEIKDFRELEAYRRNGPI